MRFGRPHHGGGEPGWMDLRGRAGRADPLPDGDTIADPAGRRRQREMTRGPARSCRRTSSCAGSPTPGRPERRRGRRAARSYGALRFRAACRRTSPAQGSHPTCPMRRPPPRSTPRRRRPPHVRPVGRQCKRRWHRRRGPQPASAAPFSSDHGYGGRRHVPKSASVTSAAHKPELCCHLWRRGALP